MVGPGGPCPPATQPSRRMVGGEALCPLPPPHCSPGLFRKLLASGSLLTCGGPGWTVSCMAPGTAHCQSLEEDIDPLIWSAPPCSEVIFSTSTERQKTGLTQKNPHGDSGRRQQRGRQGAYFRTVSQLGRRPQIRAQALTCNDDRELFLIHMRPLKKTRAGGHSCDPGSSHEPGRRNKPIRRLLRSHHCSSSHDHEVATEFRAGTRASCSRASFQHDPGGRRRGRRELDLCDPASPDCQRRAGTRTEAMANTAWQVLREQTLAGEGPSEPWAPWEQGGEQACAERGSPPSRGCAPLIGTPSWGYLWCWRGSKKAITASAPYCPIEKEDERVQLKVQPASGLQAGEGRD
ncbi:hypothetical protein NN561_001828 [Cricetulus griseus]